MVDICLIVNFSLKNAQKSLHLKNMVLKLKKISQRSYKQEFL